MHSSADYFYKAAKSWALEGQAKAATNMLDSAFQYGYGHAEDIQIDPDFSLVSNTPEFIQLVKDEINFASDKEVSMTDILMALKQRKVVKIEGATVSNEFGAFYAGPYDVNELLSMPEIRDIPLTTDSLFDFSDRELYLTNCRGKVHLEGLKLKGLSVISELGLNSEDRIESIMDWDVVALYRVNVDEFSFNLNGFQFVRFHTVTASQIPEYSVSSAEYFEIMNSQLTLDFVYYQDGYFPYYEFGNKEEKIESIKLLDSEFTTSADTNSTYSFIIPLALHGTSIVIENSTFHDEVSFLESSWESIKLIENSFKRPVDLGSAYFPEFNNYLPFNQFEQGLGVPGGSDRLWEDKRTKYLITGEKDEVGDVVSFHHLINSYQFLYTNYRSRGEIYSGNSSYVRMKDIVLNREKYLYDQEPTFQRYIRYQIGKLLKYYTDHGTNPAKAIVISIYIILAFSVLYVFFPSEWDTTSHTRLSNAFGRISRNDENKVMAYLQFVKDLLISWFKAIILSLNAFVTLGFGAVPTTGVARYLCVIQGFIGVGKKFEPDPSHVRGVNG